MSHIKFSKAKKHHELETISIDGFTLPDDKEQNRSLSLDAPAYSVVTLFNEKSPLCIEPNTDLDSAIAIMKKVHVRSALVSADDRNLLGIIDSRTLESRKVLTEAFEKGVSRQDLTVRDIMTPHSRLVALREADILKSTIGDVLSTLQHQGSQHILVVDTLSRHILGLISASNIAQVLHMPIDISYRASSFQEVFNSLYCHKDLA